MRHPSNMASRASRSGPVFSRRRVDSRWRCGSTVNPYSTFTASTRPANQHWLCFGCLSAASLATFSWRFNLPVASASTARSPASGYPGRARSGGSATAAAIAAQSVVLPATRRNG